jgi:hypothetical protein
VIVCATLAELEQRSPVGRSEVAFVTDVGKQFFYVADSRTLSRNPAVALPVTAGGCLVTPEGGNSRWVWFGHKPSVRLHRDGSNQTINTADAQIEWTHVSFDTFNLADLTNYRAIVPRAGLYHINLNTTTSVQTNTAIYIARIFVNGNLAARGNAQRPASDRVHISVTTITQLGPNDIITANFESSNNMAIFGSSNATYLEVAEA